MRAPKLSLPVFLVATVFAGAAARHAATQEGGAASWSTPSEEIDSSVANWAVNRLRPRSARQAKPDGPNPLRPATTTVEAPAPSEPLRIVPVASATPIEQVRYQEDRYAPKPIAAPGANPLRAGDAAAPSEQSPEARLAFDNNASRPPAPNPFAALPQDNAPLRLEAGARPAPPATTRPEAQSKVTSPPEPRAFQPLATSAPAKIEIEADDAAPARIQIPDDAEPLDFRTPGDGDGPSERVATIAPLPIAPSNDVQRGAEPGGVEPQAWVDAPASTASLGQGGGRPGGRELEGPQQAAIVVEKRGPNEARVGQTSRFVITVRNAGRATAENVVLRDEAPRGARLRQTIPPATQEGGRLIWSLGSLAPGEERGVEVQVVPTEEGQVGSVASVSFETRASAALTSTRPALAVKLQAPHRVALGGPQRIQIEVSNPGTGVARNVMLLEDVPDGMRHEAGPALELEIGALAPGESRSMELTLTAAQAGRVVNTVTAIADGDLRAEESIEFDVVAPSLAVAVDGPERRYLQRPAKYAVRVENPGTAPARDVRLVTHLPRGLEFVSANNLGEYDAQTHAVYWSLAELPENQSGAVEVVALPVEAGEHTLRVESETRSGLKAAESQTVVVEGMASLAFDIRDLQDPIEVGGEAAYDVVVLNEGTKAATGVRVTVDAPAGMRVVSAQGKTSHRQTDERVEFAPIEALEPGVKVLYRVRLRGEQPGDQRVTVAVASDDLRQPIRREESTRVFAD